MEGDGLDERAVEGYDIIGDIHGCGSLLRKLLEHLGYSLERGVYRHPTHLAVFLGDLLDRGPEIRDVVNVARNMVEAGAAQMVLGNHEFAAIAYSTPAAEGSVSPYLRKHTERIKRMLRQTLLQYAEYPAEWASMVEWFRTLPLFIEYDNFRVVHACWDHRRIEQLKVVNPDLNLADFGFLSESVKKGTTANRIVERLLKGTDLPFPDGMLMMGSDGVERDRFRTKFWKSAPQTYADVVFQPDKIPPPLLGKKLTDKERKRLLHYNGEEKPLFVGHYWRRGKPRLIRNNIACLDYSAVKSGRLVAYRMGHLDTSLEESKLVWVSEC